MTTRTLTPTQRAVSSTFTPVRAGALQLQRKCACGGTPGPTGECEQCRRKREAGLQRRAAGPGPATVPPIVHEVLRSSGQPLDAGMRGFMEPRFGRDFSQVRVHTDAKAAESARAVNAAAYTVGQHITFGSGRYSMTATEGRQLLAHELTHTIQQGIAAPSASLTIEGADTQMERQAEKLARHALTSPAPQESQHPTVPRSLSELPDRQTSSPPGLQRSLFVDGPDDSNDPAANIPASKRASMVDTEVQNLCGDFHVSLRGNLGEVVEKKPGFCSDETAVASGAKPTGCCCLCTLVKDPNRWTIRVTQNIGAKTQFGSRTVIAPPSSSPVQSMHWTDGSARSATLVNRPRQITLGHELCGHAALHVLRVHPQPANRTDSDEHDPSVKIERLVWREQGLPLAQQRGLAASWLHRGESVSRVTVAEFPPNESDVATLPGTERAKISTAKQFIVANDWFVDLLGHSDPGGTAAANQIVSQKRAEAVRDELLRLGVPSDTSHNLSALVPRFTSVRGLANSQPLSIGTHPSRLRRVDILMASFPAGAQVPPAGTPTAITPVPPKSGLQSTGKACVDHLTQGAWV